MCLLGLRAHYDQNAFVFSYPVAYPNVVTDAPYSLSTDFFIFVVFVDIVVGGISDDVALLTTLSVSRFC